MTEVMVLHAALPGHLDAARAAWLVSRLPYARRLDLEARAASDRNASLLGLELLCSAAARLRGAEVDLSRLRFPAGGKPVLDGGPYFSLSHAATRVVVAVCDRCDLGIDVEDLGGDATGWRMTPDALARWTAVEAALKAAGSGLRESARVHIAPDGATAVLDAVQVQLHRIALGPDCVATLATREPVVTVRVEEFKAAPGPSPRHAPASCGRE